MSEQLDQAGQQLSAAQTKLSQVRVRLKNANTQFQTAQANVAANAAAAFENTGATSIAGVLTSGNPSVILQQGSLLMELSGNRNAQTKQLLTDASQLAGVEQEMSRTEAGIAGLKRQLSDHKSSLGKLIDTQKATLASLTVPQQQAVQTNSIGAGGTGTTSATYSGTTSTQGGKAVAFAYAQLGKPYQWGATGPGSYDCSGLVQAAWASAGVSIPRTTYAQWAALPHISTSALEPGDLLYFDGVGHVAIYVGGGDIIDAPQTGQDVQKIPLAGWYKSTLVGAARPYPILAGRWRAYRSSARGPGPSRLGSMTLRRDQINRHRERARDERAELDAVLDAGHHVGTLSTVADGRPWVVPMLYGRAGDRILMHGSVGAGALRYVATGAPAALCVMHVDGWVYAHTLFDSSANYRSAVVHGELRALSGDEAAEALTQISECLTPGRSGEVPFHTKKQLAATTALAMDIVEGQWTVKIRDAGPGEPEPGEATPGLWTGILPIVSAYGHPRTSDHVPADTPVSPSVLTVMRARAAISSAVTRPIRAAAPWAMVSGSRE